MEQRNIYLSYLIQAKQELQNENTPFPKGIYIDNCTYNKIKALNENKLDEKVINVIETSKIVDDNNTTNPFEEKKTW